MATGRPRRVKITQAEEADENRHFHSLKVYKKGSLETFLSRGFAARIAQNHHIFRPLLTLANSHVRGEVGLAIGTFFHLGPPLQKRNDTNQTNQKTKMNKDKLKGKNQRLFFFPMIGIIRKDI